MVFIDYSAAFDSVSHKFIDATLQKAGASNKLRAMFRAVYKSATAYTTVKGTDNTSVRSELFQICRGVVQGDITSPLYFILALEHILRLHDARADKGVTLGQTIIHTLGYADDAALVDDGDEDGLERASDRVTTIAAGSRKDADMNISISKTKALHVRDQDEISATTAKEAKAVCKFVCPHYSCKFTFRTYRGMLIHAGKCKCSTTHEVDRIVDCSGDVLNRQYKVRWQGYLPSADTWEPRSHFHPTIVNTYEKVNGIFNYDWPHRCSVCESPCASQHGVKIHAARAHKAAKEQDFKHRLADRAVQVQKLAAQQVSRPTVTCEDQPLENKFKFKYLGTIFSADGLQDYDIDARIATAKTRCGKLRSIFDSKHLSLALKIRLYAASICSLLSYGSETWNLTEKVQRKLNGANSLMLARITGRSYRDEARPSTTSYNLVARIRATRFKWLGHILRQGNGRLIYQAL